MMLLDTDILIDYLRGFPPSLAWFGSLTELPAVPGFVAMELVQGRNSKTEVEAALRMVQSFSIVWPTEADCNAALSVYARCHLSHNMGLIDALIAASVVGRIASLCTFNQKHYVCYPGLNTIQPYSRTQP